MATEIGALAVRRSIWIDAEPERVWEEFDPPSELTFEQDWIGHGWPVPMLITFRLTPFDGGTLVELFHRGFERLGPDAAENHRGFEGGWTMLQLEALYQRVSS